MTHENTDDFMRVHINKYLSLNGDNMDNGKRRKINHKLQISSKDEFRLLQVYNDLCLQLQKDPNNKRLKSDILILENYIALL